MKIHGTNIILLNDMQHILLHLRNDKPDIPYPNMWGLPGGHMDEQETPEACIRRDIETAIQLFPTSLGNA